MEIIKVGINCLAQQFFTCRVSNVDFFEIGFANWRNFLCRQFYRLCRSSDLQLVDGRDTQLAGGRT